MTLAVAPPYWAFTLLCVVTVVTALAFTVPASWWRRGLQLVHRTLTEEPPEHPLCSQPFGGTALGSLLATSRPLPFSLPHLPWSTPHAGAHAGRLPYFPLLEHRRDPTFLAAFSPTAITVFVQLECTRSDITRLDQPGDTPADPREYHVVRSHHHTVGSGHHMQLSWADLERILTEVDCVPRADDELWGTQSTLFSHVNVVTLAENTAPGHLRDTSIQLLAGLTSSSVTATLLALSIPLTTLHCELPPRSDDTDSYSDEEYSRRVSYHLSRLINSLTSVEVAATPVSVTEVAATAHTPDIYQHLPANITTRFSSQAHIAHYEFSRSSRVLSKSSPISSPIPSPHNPGVIIGGDRHGAAVLAPMYGPYVSSVLISGADDFMVAMVIRIMATGPHAVVVSDRPHLWRTVRDRIHCPSFVVADLSDPGPLAGAWDIIFYDCPGPDTTTVHGIPIPYLRGKYPYFPATAIFLDRAQHSSFEQWCNYHPSLILDARIQPWIEVRTHHDSETALHVSPALETALIQACGFAPVTGRTLQKST